VADSVALSGTFSVTGGGDTATVILEQDLSDSFDFISTGGGAMLDFLVDGTLPGIDIILNKE
jgi:3-phosphoglycerate kinase